MCSLVAQNQPEALIRYTPFDVSVLNTAIFAHREADAALKISYQLASSFTMERQFAWRTLLDNFHRYYGACQLQRCRRHLFEEPPLTIAALIFPDRRQATAGTRRKTGLIFVRLYCQQKVILRNARAKQSASHTAYNTALFL